MSPKLPLTFYLFFGEMGCKNKGKMNKFVTSICGGLLLAFPLMSTLMCD
jgi:hypothetical protein